MDRRPPATLPPAVRGLLRHFRTQRPLRGGSLLITIFGDAIAPRGGAVTLGSLIRLAAPFGLTERLVRTLLIHEYRKIHLQDPQLPPALLPADWIGAAAYELCRRLYAQLFAGAEAYLSATARQLQRPLPAANSAAHARFGGVGMRAPPP